MYRKKSFISLSLSLMLAMGSLAAPVGAAEFSDGEVQAVQQQDAEAAQAEEFSDVEQGTGCRAGRRNRGSLGRKHSRNLTFQTWKQRKVILQLQTAVWRSFLTVLSM